MEKALTKVGSFWSSRKPRKKSPILPTTYSFSNTVEEKAKRILIKLRGKPAKTLPDLVREHNLLPGLFPSNITCYEFDESKGKPVVYLPYPCKVCFKDSSVVSYANRVKGTICGGKLIVADGMKTKVMVWVKVTSVAVESYKSDKVCFKTAALKKSRLKDAYEMPREAIKVEEF